MVHKSVSWYSNPSRGIQIRLVVFKSVSWYSIRLVVFNPSRGIEISFVVFKSVSWYLNPSRGIPTRNMVFKSGSWYSNSSRGIQIHLVVFKFVSWHSNSSRGGKIRLCGIQIVCCLRLIALDSIVGNCCWFSMCIVVIFHVNCCTCVYCCDLQCNCIMCVGHVTLVL